MTAFEIGNDTALAEPVCEVWHNMTTWMMWKIVFADLRHMCELDRLESIMEERLIARDSLIAYTMTVFYDASPHISKEAILTVE